MTQMIPIALLAVAMTLGTGSLAVANTKPADQSRVLFDFSDSAQTRVWQTVNDNVMGGVSQGGFRLGSDGSLFFGGVLSLENRGGFSQIRTRSFLSGLEGFDAIKLRVRGDGRSYWFDLRTTDRLGAGSYRMGFDTVPGEWLDVVLPFDQFRFSAFGREVRQIPALAAGDIRSVGLTIYDGKDGPFRLEIDSISAVQTQPAKSKAVEESPDAKSGPSAVAATTPASDSVVEAIVANPELSTLARLVNAAGLVEALNDAGTVTVLAPRNDAFAGLSADDRRRLLSPAGQPELRRILLNHVVAGELLIGSTEIQSLAEVNLSVVGAGTVTVGGAEVLAESRNPGRWVIIEIDRILAPPAEPAPAAIDQRAAIRSAIELAIQRGVPLFNQGQTEACAAIYEVTLAGLLDRLPGVVPAQAERRIISAFEQARGIDDAAERAWAFRRILDAVFVLVSTPRTA